jgi:hypothetical protein
MTKQARASIPSVFDDGETTPSGKAVKQKPARGSAGGGSQGADQHSVTAPTPGSAAQSSAETQDDADETGRDASLKE